MNGGGLPHDFWTRLDGKFKEVNDKIDATNRAVNEIRAFGCAKRPDDLRRIDDLESWKNRGILGIIAALFMSCGALLGMFLGHK